MKKIIFLLLGFPLTGVAQYVTFTWNSNGTNKISVPQGEVWQVVNWCGANSYEYFIFKLSATREIRFSGTGSELRGELNLNSPIGLILQGPSEILSSAGTSMPDGAYFLVFKKLSSVSQTSSIGATSVVIPSSASGDVDVKMEQSADNVTWTECLPGTYNSSTVKRFFRLRAVER